uniref:Sperm-associated antigen 5 isoform X2 n=1 Tax=Geotrypetes seraphini TaxID=260995 RepID=A0A6P8PCQ7_GEOSA|nr:sperm-associated antigen 5 isoform X2 [Geotrypetes seraphini]
MWTVKEAALDENEMGVIQTPQQKSSGRNPLQDITVLSGTNLEPNILAAAQCSVSKLSSSTPLLNTIDYQPKVLLNTTANLETRLTADADLSTVYLQTNTSSTILFNTDHLPEEIHKPECCEDGISQLSLSCLQLSPSADLPLLREQEQKDTSALNLYKAVVPESHDLMTLTSQVECGDVEVACMLGMPGGNGVGIAQSTENETSETIESSKANACTFLYCAALHCNLEASESMQPPLECELSSISLTHISPQTPHLNGSTDAAFSKVLAAAQSDHAVDEISMGDTSILHSAELEGGNLLVHEETEELKAFLDLSELCTLLASSPEVTKGQEIDNFSRTVQADSISFMESASPLSNSKASEDLSEMQDSQSSLTAKGDLQKLFISNLLHEDGNLGHSLNKVNAAEGKCPQTESDRQHLLRLEENVLQTMTPHTENRSTSSCKNQENKGEADLIVKKEEYIYNFILPSGDKSQSLIFSEEEQKERLSIHVPAEAGTWTMPASCCSRSMSPVLRSSAVTWMTPLMLLEKSMNTSVACEAVRCDILSPVSQKDISTSVTPVTSSCAVTWVTPLALLERSMNTSGDFSSILGKGEASVKDSTAETDSLLWNFSRENLNSLSKNELENHLEHMLIIIEVLSRQLQDWQSNPGLVSHLRPSEQRETFTQTNVTHATQEEKYHYNLYVKAMEKINSLQNSNEDEERLKKELQKAFESLKSLYGTSLGTFEFAEKIYQLTQEEKKAVSHDVCRIREFLSKQTVLQHKMNEKMQDCLQQQKEMKSQLEEAIQAKANGYLEDLKIHSSSVINQLRLDLESEKDLFDALKEACKEQLIYHMECKEFSHNCKSLCSNMEENQDKLQLQCMEMKKLLTQHRLVMEKMSEQTQAAMEKSATMQREKEKMYAELEKCNTQNEQITLERARLAAEVASLMKNLAESNQVRARNEKHVRDELIKSLEQEQAEEKERLKQMLSEAQQQKHELQKQICKLEEQQSSFQGELKMCKEQIDELQIQLDASAKNGELVEEENYVCREQLIEIEKQLKSSLSLLWESKLQCEEQKDTIQLLRRDKETLEEELDTTKAEARDMLLKMGKEISDSFGQITRMKEKLLDLSGSLKAALLEEDLADDNSVTRTPARFAIHTPTSSFVGSVLKAAQSEAESDNEEEKSDGLVSEKSAFTKVQPTTPKVPDFEVSMPDILSELRGIIANLSITASQLNQNKTQEIHKLKKELSDLQDKQWKLNFQYTDEIGNLKKDFISLKVEKENQCKILISKEQTLKQLQEIIQEQEKKYLQLLHERRDTENLYSEIFRLKQSLQILETEKSVLQEELAKSEETSKRDWLEKRISLEKEATNLRLMYLEAEDSKSEIIARTTRNTETLEMNLFRFKKEVKKLDDLLERIRKALLSIPDMVANCQELKGVMDLLGWWEDEKHWKGATYLQLANN